MWRGEVFDISDCLVAHVTNFTGGASLHAILSLWSGGKLVRLIESHTMNFSKAELFNLFIHYVLPVY